MSAPSLLLPATGIGPLHHLWWSRALATGHGPLATTLNGMPVLREVHGVGLAGPSHSYGGLSLGNLASQAHANQGSGPRAAARQCLGLMRTLIGLGVEVILLPPLWRPDRDLLAGCGFAGPPLPTLVRAEAKDPALVRRAWSSAAMWAANAATVAPGVDSDGITRLLVANLVATSHRAREAAPRLAMLRRIFADVPKVEVLDPVPGLADLADEGAANHLRLCNGDHDHPAVHVFVHGRAAGLDPARLPQRHPARQTLAASQAVARRLNLPSARCLHPRQHPRAIDAGAFHNDVVAIGDRDRLLLHEHSLVDQDRVLAQLRCYVPDLRVRVVLERELPLDEAVRSYLFNGSLIGDTLVVPRSCATGPSAEVGRRLVAEGFLARVIPVDLDQSMANGGGPACLRLRICLDEAQIAALPKGLRMDPDRLTALEHWVDAHYRERLAVTDLADARLVAEHASALTSLAGLVGLDDLYPDTPWT